METMTTEGPVAVMAPREQTGHPYSPPQHLWPATPKGVHNARHALDAELIAWGMGGLRYQAALVLSELMTNAQKYGYVRGRSIGTSFTRTASETPGVVLEVHDARGGSLPVLVKAGDSDEQGRGLGIVDVITEGKWGVTAEPGLPGKVIWAVVAGPASGAPTA